MDHCREGCIEMELENDRCCCVRQGEMRIDTRVHHKGLARFPLRHYHGITVGFQTGIAEESIREMMPAFEIDIKTLLNKFCKSDGICVLAQDPSIDNLFTQLYRLPEKAQPYFYKSQVEKIHGIFEISLTPMKQCFKSTYGQSIYKYLREYRMNRAAEMLLTEPGKKVTDIAAACGYENPGKFGQAFREQFGVAPLEYRRSNGRRD